jgi:hypothetical protein
MTLDVKRYPILWSTTSRTTWTLSGSTPQDFDILTATSGPEALGILAEKDVAVWSPTSGCRK